MDRFERFTTQIFHIYRYIQRIKTMEMTDLGLKGNQVLCLFHLFQHPEGLTPTELCRRSEEDKAAVSRTLRELEEKGHVSRPEEAERKRYRTKVFLTEQGKQTAAIIQQRSASVVEKGGAGLSEEQREQLYTALDRISSNLATLCQDEPT